MKITKDYEGLTRIENGDYVFDGDLVSSENMVIELDDRFVVKGSIKCDKSIISSTSIIANGGIKAGDGIKAGCGIEAGDGIKAGCGIEAGDGIKAGTYIDCGKRIFAGTSLYLDEDSCDKVIRCCELRRGVVAYGDLVIEERSNALERKDTSDER